MAKRSTINYTQLSKAKIQPSRNLVISSCSKGGFTLAQQLDVNEGGRKTSVFLAGAFIVENLEALYNLRDAINVAIEATENDENLKAAQQVSQETNVDDDDWDEE